MSHAMQLQGTPSYVLYIERIEKDAKGVTLSRKEVLTMSDKTMYFLALLLVGYLIGVNFPWSTARFV